MTVSTIEAPKIPETFNSEVEYIFYTLHTLKRGHSLIDHVRDAEFSEEFQKAAIIREIRVMRYLQNPCPFVVEYFNFYIKQNFHVFHALTQSQDHYSLANDFDLIFTNHPFASVSDENKKMIGEFYAEHLELAKELEVAMACYKSIFDDSREAYDEIMGNIYSCFPSDEDRIKFKLHST